MQNIDSRTWKHRAFLLVVLSYLGLLGLINMLMFLPDWLGWLPFDIAGKISAMGHFDFIRTGDTHDIIHEFVFASVLGTAAVGLLFQFWKPLKNVAGQLIALIVWSVLISTAIITNSYVPQPLFIIFGGLTILATVLHPAGRGLFNWFGVAKMNRILLALVIIAAVPLIAFASSNIGLQTASSETAGFFGHLPPAAHTGDSANQEPSLNDTGDEQKHINLGHYRNIAAFSFIVILAGILASFRPPGWRLAVWVAGILPILLGLASILLPNAESSLSLVWSLAAVVWGTAFVVAAEFVRRRQP